MSHDVLTDGDLVALLRGELDRTHTGEVIDHLRQCDECRSELVEVARVHGSLTAAGRLLQGSTLPPSGRISAAVTKTSSDNPLEASHRSVAGTVHLSTDLPPLRAERSLRFARSGRASRDQFSRRTRSSSAWQSLRPRAVTVMAACVAAVLVVGGVAVGLGAISDRSDRNTVARPDPAVGRSVALAPVSASGGTVGTATGVKVGQVTMAGRVVPVGQSGSGTKGTMRMTISVTLAPASAGKFYYAWLLDPKTRKMLPLGVVSESGETEFDVSADLVSRYRSVDISLEDDDGDPVHSATSVMRGSY